MTIFRTRGRHFRAAAAALIATSLAPGAVPVAAADVQPLTVEQLVSQPSITGTAPAAPAWAPDGSSLAFLWNDSGMPERHIWIVARGGDEPRRLLPASDTGVSELAWTPDGTGLVSIRDGDIWLTTVANGADERLTKNGGRKSSLAVSPDGRHASFLQDGDLWLLALETTRLSRATKVGVPTIAKVTLGRYARPEVEIGPPIWGGLTYRWSPDSKMIAVHYVDRRGIRQVPFPDYLGDDTIANPVRRGYPGDANELRTVGIFTLADGELRLMDLPDPTANQVVDFSWSAGGALLLDRASDTAIDRWLDIVDAETLERRQIWHDRRESRVYTPAASAWHPDGKRVVFLGDLDDRLRLYALTPGDATPVPLTGPGYDVTGGPFVAGGDIFFTANSPSPREKHIFRIPGAGGDPVRITALPGHNDPFPAPDGGRVAFLHSDDVMPPELFVQDRRERNARRITHSAPAAFAGRSWTGARYVSFPSRIDDYTLHARILEPEGLDRSRRHPVIFGPVYSGTVRNRWSGRYSAIQQLLVDRGYIVVQVDVRGSTGYGRAFREAFLMDFAGGDLEDLHSAVDYMKTLPYVDPHRIGLWGSSYGGTLTVYSLLKKPGVYRAGVAAAAAVDPYFFGPDDIAIVRRPDTHPEAFARGASQYAANLQDHLLIIHGMQDQVVPFRTTVALAEALIRAGKDFDFAFAPTATHGWTRDPANARYLLGKLVEHFDRYLGAAPAEAEPEPAAR